MLRRFVAASAVACIAIAFASCAALVISSLNPQRFSLVLAIWCIAPAVWGLWAMLSPRSWFPERLPAWGAILGVVAGLLAAFVLDIPGRITGLAIPATVRVVGVLVMTVFYFVLWTLVRMVFKNLSGTAAALPEEHPARQSP